MTGSPDRPIAVIIPSYQVDKLFETQLFEIIMPSNTYFKTGANGTLAVSLLGLLLVAGCGERTSEVAALDGANSCANPGTPTNVFASKFDPATKQGWYVNGPSFPEQNKDLPMGRFENQVVVELAVPAGAVAARISLPVSATMPTAVIILDTIWYSGLKEVGRSAPNIEFGKAPGNAINTTQPVAPGADRLMLIARPWRDIDGIVTVGESGFAWCKK